MTGLLTNIIATTQRLLKRSANASAVAAVLIMAMLFTSTHAFAQTVIYQDDFESGASGWSNNTTENASMIGTRILGRFGGSTPQVSRTFTVPAGSTALEIEFDLLRIDSWDFFGPGNDDGFSVLIDGNPLFSTAASFGGPFPLLAFPGGQGARSGTTGNVTWSHVPINPAAGSSPRNLDFRNFGSFDFDQIHRFTITVNNPGATVDLTLRIDSDQSINDESAAYDNFLVTAVAPVPTADLETVKTLSSGNSVANIGETVSFDIVVTNNGPEDTTNVSLTDLLPANLTATANNGTVSAGTYNAVSGAWTIPSLAIGESETLTLEGLIEVAASGSTITNTTTAASSDLADSDTAGDQLTAAVNVNAVTPDPQIGRPNQCGVFNHQGWITPRGTPTENSLTFGSGDPRLDPYLVTPLTRDSSGRIISYLGVPDEIGSGSIPDFATTNLIATPTTTPDHRSEFHQVVYRLEGAAGSSETITLEMQNAAEHTAYWIEDTSGAVLSAADFVLTRPVANSGVGPDVSIPITYPADEIVYLYVSIYDSTVNHGRPRIRDYTCPEADLVTEKTLASADATPDIGDTVAFDIAITNNGPSDAINTTLTDLLPAGLTATANNGTVSDGAYDAGTGNWTIPSLANGATATLTLEGTADLAAAGTTITNITTAATSDIPDSDTTGDALEASVDVLEASPALTLTKTASNDTDVQVGDVITYTYVVENTGNVEMSDVLITDVHLSLIHI